MPEASTPGRVVTMTRRRPLAAPAADLVSAGDIFVCASAIETPAASTRTGRRRRCAAVPNQRVEEGFSMVFSVLS
jgi:hypothetical protein